MHICINHFINETMDSKNAIRRYSVPRIIDELKHLKDKYNVGFFKFNDEDFLMRPLENLEELEELSEAHRKEINIPFSIETNPKTITKEKARLLKNMNCVSASIAIETGNLEKRKNMLQRVDTENDILTAFPLMNEMNIRTASFVMLGLPYETRGSYQETIDLVKKAQVQYPQCGFFYPKFFSAGSMHLAMVKPLKRSFFKLPSTIFN